MRNILIVEDELFEQEFLKSIIEREINCDDNIITCESGLDAIKLSKEFKPEIILMDIMIMELDGLSAIKKIREFLPNSCISIMSAYSDFSYAQKAISLDVFEYLLKPVKPKDFIDCFKRMIQKTDECNRLILEAINKQFTPKDCKEQFMDKALTYIKTNFKEKLVLDDVASIVYMSPKYFSQVFKKEVGISFSNYINNMKIEYACKLLQTTDYPAYRISMECGFSDPSYFNRVFSNKMNMTPQTYKKYICEIKQ